jgi:putative solute:sodium symporter small subunit
MCCPAVAAIGRSGIVEARIPINSKEMLSMATTPQRTTQTQVSGTSAELAAAYWKENVRIIGSLLGIWAFVSFVAGYFLAGPLNGVPFGNVPLSFWIAQQGAIIVFVILIFVYAKLMDRLDEKYDVHE